MAISTRRREIASPSTRNDKMILGAKDKELFKNYFWDSPYNHPFEVPDRREDNLAVKQLGLGCDRAWIPRTGGNYRAVGKQR